MLLAPLLLVVRVRALVGLEDAVALEHDGVSDVLLPPGLLNRSLLLDLFNHRLHFPGALERPDQTGSHLLFLLTLLAEGQLATAELLVQVLPAGAREGRYVLLRLLGLLQEQLYLVHLVDLLPRHALADAPLLGGLHDRQGLLEVLYPLMQPSVLS